MPRYVLLRHDSPGGVHYDLMLHWGQVLRTWALPEVPEPGKRLECRALEDHRLEYLDYEGPVSGERGTVARFASGTFSVLQQNDELLEVALSGERLAGRLTLRRIEGRAGQWQCDTV